MAMLTRMQYDILLASARSLQALLKEMQSEAELFASANTLQRVEVCLLVMAQTLTHLPKPMQARLVQVDWHGWSCLEALLEKNAHPRRAEVWYGTQSLVPMTLELLATLRRQEPVWFEIGY
ncbi:MAG: hypothetical protein KA207_17610 [Burkholderiaceae bacterium]|nr:hypothetical protein [Burkholderiaceae bacterium]